MIMNKNNQKFKKTLSMRVKFFYKSFFINAQLLLMPLLIIGPYSIYKSSVDNTRAIERSMMQTLNQCSSTMEALYTQLDNAKLFFASNPRVKLQLHKAFNEKSLSLSSLRNIENLSLYFQNLMFTDPYISEIYVYYANDYQRVYKTSAGVFRPLTELENTSWLQQFKNDNADFWIEVRSSKTGIRLDETPKSLFFYQQIYSRSTHRPIGVLIFEFNLNKLAKYFDTLMQYQNQTIYLLDHSHSLVYTNNGDDHSEQVLSALLSSLNSISDNQDFFDIEIEETPCKAAFLQSARNNGLTYFTYTPSSEIYKSTKSLSNTYVFLTLCAVGLSVLLAFYKSRKEYRYLCTILDIFSNPAASQHYFDHMHQRSSNPFEYIIMNIIRLFVQQDYLKIQTSQKEYKIQMLKMHALQHQINPHFLYNTLNSIYWETVKMTGSENVCSTMVSNLSSVIRYSLSDPLENVSVREEIDYLKKYLEIMKLRYPNKFNVEFRVEPRCENYPLKKMILQPLVENSIYHGIKEKEGVGKICIGVRSFKNSIAVFIFDNGAGIQPATLKQLQNQIVSADEIIQQHMGLANTNLRLKLAYGDDSRLHIKSEEGVYTFIYFFIKYSDLQQGHSS